MILFNKHVFKKMFYKKEVINHTKHLYDLTRYLNDPIKVVHNDREFNILHW